MGEVNCIISRFELFIKDKSMSINNISINNNNIEFMRNLILSLNINTSNLENNLVNCNNSLNNTIYNYILDNGYDVEYINNILTIKNNNIIEKYEVLDTFEYNHNKKYSAQIIKDLSNDNITIIIKGEYKALLECIDKEINEGFIESHNQKYEEGENIILLCNKEITENQYTNIKENNNEINNLITNLKLNGSISAKYNNAEIYLNSENYIKSNYKLIYYSHKNYYFINNIIKSNNYSENIFEFNQNTDDIEIIKQISEDFINKEIQNNTEYICIFNKIFSNNLNKLKLDYKDIYNRLIDKLIKKEFILLFTEIDFKTKLEIIKIFKEKKKFKFAAITENKDDISFLSLCDFSISKTDKELDTDIKVKNYYDIFNILNGIGKYYKAEYYNNLNLLIGSQITVVIPNLLIGYQSNFSGTSMYNSWYYDNFSMVFIFLIISLYIVNQNNKIYYYYNIYLFIFKRILITLLITFFSYVYFDGFYNKLNGNNFGFYVFGLMVYLGCIINTCLNLILKRIKLLPILFINLVIFFGGWFLFSRIKYNDLEDTFIDTICSRSFGFYVFFTIAITLYEHYFDNLQTIQKNN